VSFTTEDVCLSPNCATIDADSLDCNPSALVTFDASKDYNIIDYADVTKIEFEYDDSESAESWEEITVPSNQSNLIVTHTYTKAATYSVRMRVEYNDGTISEVSKGVTVLKFPDASFNFTGNGRVTNDTISACVGETIELKVSYNSVEDGILWSTGDLGRSTIILPGANTNGDPARTYAAIVYNKLHTECTIKREIAVRYFPLPIIELTSDKDSFIIGSNEPVKLTATGGENLTWETISGDANSLTIDTDSTAMVAPTEKTTYRVAGELNGCRAYGQKTLPVDVLGGTVESPIDAASVFIPNSERNNEWTIVGVSEGRYNGCKVYIYNVWGQAVFKTTIKDNKFAWNGKALGADGISNGTDLPEDAYYYLVKCECGKDGGSAECNSHKIGEEVIHTGSVTILRK